MNQNYIAFALVSFLQYGYTSEKKTKHGTPTKNHLVDAWTNPFDKICSSKWVRIFPKVRGENSNIFLSCHHLVMVCFDVVPFPKWICFRWTSLTSWSPMAPACRHPDPEPPTEVKLEESKCNWQFFQKLAWYSIRIYYIYNIVYTYIYTHMYTLFIVLSWIVIALSWKKHPNIQVDETHHVFFVCQKKMVHLSQTQRPWLRDTNKFHTQPGKPCTLLETNISPNQRHFFESMIFPNFPCWDMWSFPRGYCETSQPKKT